MSKKPTLTAFCRTKSINDFRTLLQEVTGLQTDNDRRRNTRVAKSLVIFVQPLDNSFQPKGKPFKSVTRDISPDGVSFIHDAPFPTNFARISATATSAAKSIVRICFNKVYYSDEMVYLIGTEFLPALECEDT